MKNLKNHSTAILTFLTGVVGHHYISKILDYKNEKKLSIEQNEQETVVDKNFDDLKNHLLEAKEQTKINHKLLEKLQGKNIPAEDLEPVSKTLETGEKSCKSVLEYFTQNKNKEVNMDIYLDAYEKSLKCVESMSKANRDLRELLDKYKNKFISNINMDEFKVYLNKLSLLEESALLHLIVFTLILIAIFNIFSALFGNEVIKFFNLEAKYPKLLTFFKLRLKFQRYYLSLNLLLIFLVCVFAIFINILVLY